jgi:hypothetical protein
MSSVTVVFTSKNVLLPDHAIPQPATIKIDKTSGKITNVQLGYRHNTENAPDEEWIDAGEKFILPGLVECVQWRSSNWVANVHLSLPVLMSILTNLVAPTGKAFGRERELLLLEALLLWSICL